MACTSSESVPVFETCGLRVPLEGVTMPNQVTITHPICEIAEEIAKRRRQGDNGDVIINIDERTLCFHEELLKKIPFFRDLFNSKMSECKKGEINLSNELCGFDMDSIEHLLDYVYTGHLRINEEKVQDLMLAASFLRMESVMNECAEFMRRRLTIDNIFSILYFCRAIGYTDIDSFLFDFIDMNFVPLSHSCEFLKLSLQDFEFFIQRDTLRVEDEKQVFDAVTLWIKHENDRKIFADMLLKCIRCPTLPLSFINETIEKSEWVMDNANCIALVNEAKDCIENKTMRKACASFKTTERICDVAYFLFMSIMNAFPESDSTDKFLHVYNPVSNKWTKINHQSRAEEHYEDCERVAYFRDKIGFIRPLEDSVEDGKIFELFDAASNEWHSDKERIEEHMPRSDLYGSPVKCIIGAVTEWLDGYTIYVAGGQDEDGYGKRELQTFDDATKEWKSLAPMSKCRSWAGSGTVKKKLYMFGGIEEMNDNVESYNSCECYDPETDSWTPISPMKYRRHLCATITFKNHIYVIGGAEGDMNKVLSEVERYDPATDTWTSLKSMNTKRCGASIGLSCGKFFVFGGYDSLKDPYNLVRSVEMYDPLTDTWEYREPMPEESFCLPLIIPASLPLFAPNIEGFWISEFRNFHLKEELYKAMVECGFLNTTEVQSACISQAIKGLDIICRAPTESGKTATYVIATLQQLDPNNGEFSVLVLCPTREKAEDIKEEYERCSKYLPAIKVASFAGEVPINEEPSSENRPHIIIGTPVRIYELVKSGAINLDNIKHLILDNCDRSIYNQVFSQFSRHPVKKILDSTPKEKQLMIFTEVLRKTHNYKSYLRSEEHTFKFTLETKKTTETSLLRKLSKLMSK